MISTAIEGEIEFNNLSFSYSNSDKKAYKILILKYLKDILLESLGKLVQGKPLLVKLIIKALYVIKRRNIY